LNSAIRMPVRIFSKMLVHSLDYRFRELVHIVCLQMMDIDLAAKKRAKRLVGNEIIGRH